MNLMTGANLPYTSPLLSLGPSTHRHSLFPPSHTHSGNRIGGAEAPCEAFHLCCRGALRWRYRLSVSFLSFSSFLFLSLSLCSSYSLRDERAAAWHVVSTAPVAAFAECSPHGRGRSTEASLRRLRVPPTLRRGCDGGGANGARDGSESVVVVVVAVFVDDEGRLR